MEWYGANVIRCMKPSLDKAVYEGAVYLLNRLIETVSEPYPPASEPGEPPHERTGDLIESLGIRGLGDAQYQLGSSSIVAVYLEGGTSKMEPRPFFMPCIHKYRYQAGKVIAAAARRNL